MLSPADLPNDIAALKALLLAQDEVMEGLREQLNTRAVEIEHLKLQIAKLRRFQFGRKSESWPTRSCSWNCSWRTCRPTRVRHRARGRCGGPCRSICRAKRRFTHRQDRLAPSAAAACARWART
jgi:hypothetical protein